MTKRYGGVKTYKDIVIVDTLGFVSVKDSLFGFDNRYETMMYVPFSKNDDTKFELKAGFLNQNGYRAHLYFGDGFKGKPAFAPFDGIIVTCGAPYVPDELKYQLSVGVIMVIPVGEQDEQQMKVIIRLGEDVFEENTYGDFKFVPMLKNIKN